MEKTNINYLLYSYLLCYLVCKSSLLDIDISDENNYRSIEDSCKSHLEYFANATSHFIKCAIRHARPIRLCERCVNYYLDVLKAHEDILKAKDKGGHACKMELVNLDRLEVIEGAFNYVYNLWQKGHCDSCFVLLDNGTLTPQLSNSTVKFQSLYNATYKCIGEHYNDSSKSYDSTVCANCTEKYCTLNKYYEDLKANSEDGMICMDIVDSMNATRTKWSKRLNCSLSMQIAEIPFIISAAVISVTPIIFYVAAKQFSGKAESRLMRQKRLSMQFHGPSTTNS